MVKSRAAVCWSGWILRVVVASGIATAADSGIQYLQQGEKITGNDAAPPSHQGVSVALSADGNTALVGGYTDNNDVGAAWVYTRSGKVWSQPGAKLFGTPILGATSLQGVKVALSGDGKTALIGGDGDDDDAGAAWVFMRAGNTWTQQAKLVGEGAVGESSQGWSLALSADGNTAVVGGPYDNNEAGAAWVFTRSNGVWAQQGGKLIGAGASGPAMQGTAVALSADGNTAAIEGSGDDGDLGAMWIFSRSNSVWRQQGEKLVGSPRQASIRRGLLGQSVALTADGNLAVLGAYVDDSGAGAIFVFARAAGVWTQQGSKLVGTGAAGSAWQGFSVALSADGSTLMEGGLHDNNAVGAAWIFTANPHITAAGVVNAASFAHAGVVAPGEIVTIFGVGIGPGTLAGMQLDASGKVANQLSQTRVLFNGVAAPLIYVSASQSSAIVPYAVAGKQSSVLTIEYQGQLSNAASLPVLASAPGLFTTSSSGTGQGAVLNQNGSVNSAANPAERGSVVVLFGTGEGQTSPLWQDGVIATTPLPKPVLPVSVKIGGQAAQVMYAGAAPMLVAGVIQINAEVPAGIMPGPSTPVEVTIGDQTSKAGVTLATR